MSIFISHPEVRAHFFPSLGRDTSKRIVMDTRGADSLVSVTTHKDLRAPAGTFSVTMTPRVPGPVQTPVYWKDLLRIGDLVVLEMGPDRPQPGGWYNEKVKKLTGLEIVMIGAVDDIRERFSMGADGRPSTLVTVTGRDFGKYFVDDTIWFDTWGQPMSATIKLADFLDRWMKTHRIGSPNAVMMALLNFMFRAPGSAFPGDFGGHDILFDLGHKGTNGVQQFGQTLLSHMLRVSLSSSIGQIPFPSSILSYEGAPWNLMQQVSGAPFYTLLLDTRRKIDADLLIANGGETTVGLFGAPPWNTDLGHFDVQPALLYYRTPFSNRDYDDWLSLPLRVVREDDVISTDFGVGIDEVNNTWRVIPEAAGFYKGPAKGAAADLETRDPASIQRYGDRPLMQSSPFFSADNQPAYLDLMRTLSKRLQDFNILNEYFLNGSLEMKGMAQAKVGDRLWYQLGAADLQPGIDFYIEAVTQDFQQFSGWKTTVELTRGQTHRERGTTLPWKAAPPVDTLANLARVWGKQS